jgi:CBS domain-containing protein
MRAGELAEEYPVVQLDTDALTAALALSGRRLPGLIVVDREGEPYTVLPGSHLLRVMIPGYIQEDPSLARVVDERASDDMLRRLAQVAVRDLLPERQYLGDLPVVDADAAVLEVAAVMARVRSPIVAVVDQGRLVGAVTFSRLLEHLLPEASPSHDPEA